MSSSPDSWEKSDTETFRERHLRLLDRLLLPQQPPGPKSRGVHVVPILTNPVPSDVQSAAVIVFMHSVIEVPACTEIDMSLLVDESDPVLLGEHRTPCEMNTYHVILCL